MKRKLLTAILSATLIITSTGCGNTTGTVGDNVENSQSVGADVGTEIAEADRTNAAEKEENTAENSGGEEEQPTAAELMKQVNAKESAVLDDNYRTWYEVFVYSFYDSDGDGVGDLKGLTEKLDYINDGDEETDTDLGCNGIWLMPVMPSTTYHKYDVTDYCEIDREYGTLEDFKVLVEECHKRGINVIDRKSVV